MNNKRILIPWSGGFDSTALVIWAFSNGIPFDTCYFNITNNKNIASIELKRRKKILKKLKKKYSHNPHVEDIIGNTGIVKCKGELLLPLTWCCSLLLTMDTNKYSEVHMGYIKGDCFWHVRHEFEKMFYYGQKLKLSGITKIRYPFEWYNKQYIKNEYYGYFDDILDLVWYCEAPNGDEACEECVSCKRHNEELK